jgi:D-3-phosphoglycerate dehydrogenase
MVDIESSNRPVNDAAGSGTILVAPHRFLDLDREERLAQDFGLDLVVAPDVDSFRAGIPEAALVLVTPYARVEAADFQAMKRCIAVVRYGIGYDNIDVDAARTVGVPVSIVPGATSEEVASHAVALGLSLVRRIPAGQAAIAAHSWAGSIAYDTPRFTELAVGVVGLGRIGRQVAAWYAAVGSKVRVYDPYIGANETFETATLDELIEQSDVLSLHLPLTSTTRNFVSADVLARMRRNAVIVNVSRGGLIDEQALAEALHTGQIAGAGLDTFSEEPLPAGHVLRAAPNLIMTPHTAWRSNRALESVQDGVVQRCRQALQGQPIADLVA